MRYWISYNATKPERLDWQVKQAPDAEAALQLALNLEAEGFNVKIMDTTTNTNFSIDKLAEEHGIIIQRGDDEEEDED